MKFNILPLFFFLLLSNILYGQQTFTMLFTLEADADFITGDALGNIYIIKGSEIIKYNDEGNICCTFSNRNYGSVTSVDTRDPLRILVFYKPFGVIRLLDNHLAEQAVIDLHTLDISDPHLVCSSEIQGIWVFDNATSRLYKYNAQLQVIGLSNDLRQDVMHNINPVMMNESDYWLVMLDKESLLVFDKMGNYFKPIMVENNKSGQLIHDEWLYCTGGKLMRLNLRNGVRTEVALPFSADDSEIFLTPQRLLRFHQKSMDVYAY